MSSRQHASGEPRRRSVFVFSKFVALAAWLACLAGCSAWNPIAAAETPAQRYDAAMLTFDAVLDVAVEVVDHPDTPDDLRERIRVTANAADDVYRRGRRLFGAYLAAQAAREAGADPRHARAALDALEAWIGNMDAVTRDLGVLVFRET